VDNVKGAVGDATDGVEGVLETGKDKVEAVADIAIDSAIKIKETVFGQ
jgi:hypothetical protein